MRTKYKSQKYLFKLLNFLINLQKQGIKFNELQICNNQCKYYKIRKSSYNEANFIKEMRFNIFKYSFYSKV